MARHIFSRKKHTEKGKDAANIQSIVPYERLDGNCIVNKDGGFTGVLEIKPIEFRLLGANKQNYLIDGMLTNVLTSVGASQEAAIVKLEKPLDFDRHIQADLQRIVALAEANDKGLAPIQKTVGGHIDAVYLPGIDDVHGFCNDEGLFIGMEPNFYRPEYKDAIVGPAIFFGSGYDGGSESLSCEQVKKVTNFLTANNVKDYGEFYRNIKMDFACYKPKSVPEM